MNNLFNRFFGRSLFSTVETKKTMGITIDLHKTAKGNIKTTRSSLCPSTPTIRYVKSRRERYNG